MLLQWQRCCSEELTGEDPAIPQEGANESTTGPALGLPRPRLGFQKNGPNPSKKVGKEERNCTSLCPHSVSPLLHAVVHLCNVPAGS